MGRVNGAFKVGTSGFRYGVSKLLYFISAIFTAIVWVIDKVFLIVRKLGLIIGTGFFFSWFVHPATGSNDLKTAYITFFNSQMWKQKNGIIMIGASVFLGLIVWGVFAALYRKVHSMYEWILDVRNSFNMESSDHAQDIKRYSKIAKGDMHDEYLRLCQIFRETNVNYVSRL